jgi:long-chain acyl-CoA synthetase
MPVPKATRAFKTEIDCGDGFGCVSAGGSRHTDPSLAETQSCEGRVSRMMNFNLAVILRETALASPGKRAAVHAGGQLTYGELDALSDRLAAGLEASGIRPGAAVALQLPNIPQFLVAYFGILKAGGVVVPLNVLLKAPEVAFLLRDSAAKILITWAGVLDDAAKGAAAAGVSEIYAVGSAGDAGPAAAFERLLAASADGHQCAQRELTDTAVIMYTSGTTGRPKGAELTHMQLYMNADIPGRLFDVQHDDVVITVLPLFHVFGLSSILNVCVRFGCTMSLIPRFDPAAVLAAVQRDRATILEGVPAMFFALLAYPELDQYDVSSLRIAISGGASIPATVLNAFEERFGVLILEGYGLTETASTTTFNRSITERRVYSVGKPIWGTQTQVWDKDGNTLPPGKGNVGEVVTRGLHVMKGYLHNPEATANAFTGDWFHTGDLGYFDEDGFLFIAGRIKELIIRGGYNVYPAEVEDVLHAHPAVAEAAVIGIPHDRLGEEVMAVVTLRPGAAVTAPELIAFCKERIAAYKYPRVIEFRDELPKNALGKILKNELIPR